LKTGQRLRRVTTPCGDARKRVVERRLPRGQADGFLGELSRLGQVARLPLRGGGRRRGRAPLGHGDLQVAPALLAGVDLARVDGEFPAPLGLSEGLARGRRGPLPAGDPGRLALANDYLRTELLEAVRQEKPLIPVLIEDTPMPGPEQLPPRAGGVAAVDGMRFVVPVPTIYARPNRKYFRAKRGVTWLNMVNDQAAGLGAKVVSGTERDSLHMIDVIFSQDGGQRPDIVLADTGSHSDVVFGLVHLLGMEYQPALADLPDQRLWPIAPDADYGSLNTAARGRIDLARVRRHWDDMLRVVASIYTGTVRAYDVVRMLRRAPHSARRRHRRLRADLQEPAHPRLPR